MRCPYCGKDHDRVSDSRASDDGATIRRRRVCLQCNRRFTTYERVDETGINVVKRNGAREPFSRDKIRSGLAKACWKRPISEDQINNLVSRVESDIYAQTESEIDSVKVGELVMRRLAEVDQVAYVRFASVYRQFKDVRDFVDELQPLLRPKEPPKTNGAGE
jgi:transcriptional repressor NrdR